MSPAVRIMRPAALAAAFVSIASQAVAGLAASGQFEQVISRKGGPKPVSSTQVVRWSGPKLRIEETNGQQRKIVIADGKTVYFYDPSSKIAVLSEQPAELRSYKNVLDAVAATARQSIKRSKKTGTERVGGFSCDVYEFNHPMGKHKILRKSWINKDPKFPVEVKTVTTVGSVSTTMIVRHVRLGIRHPASTFSLPKGTKVIKHPVMNMPNPHEGRVMPKKK